MPSDALGSPHATRTGAWRLECPTCRVPLRAADDILSDETGRCPHRFPLIDGIPRLVLRPEIRRKIMHRHRDWGTRGTAQSALREEWTTATADASLAEQVVLGFDDEWRRFDDVGSVELGEIFEGYFDLVPESAFAPGRLVLDAGSGSGRWAVEVARRGPRVLAVDLGLSVDLVRRHAGGDAIVAVQADLEQLPLPRASVHWAYSLGVLHHTDDPLAALKSIVEAVKPGGFVLLYLYYALDSRGWLYRSIFRLADAARQVIATLPRPLVYWLGLVIAAVVYVPFAMVGRLLHGLGMVRASEAIPLSFYRERSFRIMRNDAVDRFGTRLERRYRRDEVVSLMQAAGLGSVRVSPTAPYWKAIGFKPSSRSGQDPSR